MNNKVKIILAIIVAGIGVLFTSGDAHAGAGLDSVAKQAQVQGAYKCYKDYKLGDGKNAKINKYNPYINGGEDTNQVASELETFSTFRQIAPFPYSGAKVVLPNDLTDEKNGNHNNKTNCSHLLNGKDDLIGDDGDGFTSSIYARFGKTEPSTSASKAVDLMKSVGYEPKTDSSTPAGTVIDSSCIHIGYKYVTELISDSSYVKDDSYSDMDEYIYYSKKICPEVDSNGYLTEITETEETDTAKFPNRGTSKTGMLPILRIPSDVLALNLQDGSGTSSPCYLPMVNDECSENNKVSYLSEKILWSDAVAKLEAFAAGVNADTAYIAGGIFGGHKDERITRIRSVIIVKDGAGDAEGPVPSDWQIMDRKTASENIVKYLGYSMDKNAKNSVRVDESHRVLLYQYYITGVAKFQVKCGDDAGSDHSAHTEVQWFQTTDKREQCWITGGSVKDNKGKYALIGDIGAVDDTAGMFYKFGSLSEIVDKLNKIDIDKLKGVDEEELVDVMLMATATDEESTANYDCYSRAESLGWVLCPIIDNLGDYVQNTYEQHITNFLVLDAGLFKEEGTVIAWRNFQNIANVIFVIIFLFVILSQLTGFGIDNYGIKKILPKLIIGAILINLSYIICQLAIDVANIVGYGIGWIFEHVGTQVSELSISEAPSSHSTAGATVLIVIIVSVLVAGAVLAIGPAVLVPVFLGLIAIAIAILSCFVILAVRKALAVVLVVISPVAFVCYMLPNTRSMFNRWFKAFQGVIIAFPVCSAMIYGGQAVARLIINASGGTTVPFMLALSAAVVSVIPMYFIPKVVSKSMGAISAGINGVANRARTAGQKRYRESNSAQDRMLRSQQLQNRRAAGINSKGNPTLRRKLGNKINDGLNDKLGDKRFVGGIVKGRTNARNLRLARANQRYANDLSENDKAARMTDSANLEKQIFNNSVKNYMDSAEFERDSGNSNVDTMYDAMKKAAESGDTVKMRAMGKALAATKEGKKKLIGGIRNEEITGKLYQELSKDSGIRSAIHEKDQFVASAMNDAAAGKSESWSSWSSDESKMQGVASGLDKSDLYSQGSDAFKDALRQVDSKGNHIISDERLASDMANPNIDMGDKVGILTNMSGAGISGRSNITANNPNSEMVDAINKMTEAYNKNTEQLKVNHNDVANNTGHNAQQGGVGNGATVNTGGSGGTVEPHSPYKLK